MKGTDLTTYTVRRPLMKYSGNHCKRNSDGLVEPSKLGVCSTCRWCINLPIEMRGSAYAQMPHTFVNPMSEQIITVIVNALHCRRDYRYDAYNLGDMGQCCTAPICDNVVVL